MTLEVTDPSPWGVVHPRRMPVFFEEFPGFLTASANLHKKYIRRVKILPARSATLKGGNRSSSRISAKNPVSTALSARISAALAVSKGASTAKKSATKPVSSSKSTVQAARSATHDDAVGYGRRASGDVEHRTIGDDADGQRLDNYLMKVFRGVPKSRLYRMVRNGEVRVNGARAQVEYKLALGDIVRLPPARVEAHGDADEASLPAPVVNLPILFEDDALLIVDKPAGMAVHGGSGVSHGVIERLRATRPDAKFLELVHRLDRETSGILIIAKRRSALTALHEQFRESRNDKRYLALGLGDWQGGPRVLDAPLLKLVVAGGERKVIVSADGQASRTDVKCIQRFHSDSGKMFSLLECRLRTGRTHQIRVHLQNAGLPIAGDDRYGDFAINKALVAEGLNRMFLHASRMQFLHPLTGERLTIESALPANLQRFLDVLKPTTEA